MNDKSKMKITQNKLISSINSIHDDKKRNQVEKLFVLNWVLYSEGNF